MFDRSLLEISAIEAAPLLLGAVVTCRGVSVRLTEVEAYLGAEDPGSHGYRGPGRRNATLFGEAGRLYCYRSYGIHICGNVVTGQNGSSSGVLMRAGEVVEGVEIARARRATSKGDADLARGPGRLGVALGLRLEDDGHDLQRGEITLRLPQVASGYATGPRTGVSGIGGSGLFPLRFWIPGDPTVSPYRAHRPNTSG